MWRKHDLDIFWLVEIKMDLAAIEKFLGLYWFGFKHFSNCMGDGKGRILLLWNENRVNVSLEYMDLQYIHVKVTCCLLRQSIWLRLSMDYTPLTLVNLCGIILRISVHQFPFCGWLWAFNSILSSADKCGAAVVKTSETCEFAGCLSQLELSDLKYVGCFFSWSNSNVRTKIDRALVNAHWLQSDSYAEFLVPGSASDHKLAIVSNSCSQGGVC